MMSWQDGNLLSFYALAAKQKPRHRMKVRQPPSPQASLQAQSAAD